MIPTEKQISYIKELTDKQLIQISTQAMHSLNRRAKKLRDDIEDYVKKHSWGRTCKERQKAFIYSLKDTFLTTAIDRKHYKSLYSFNIESDSAEHNCDCGNSFFSRNSNYCYQCQSECYAETQIASWALIDMGGGYSFHSPNLSEIALRSALEIEAHDPNQPQREIPKMGMTIEAQYFAVRHYLDRFAWHVEEKAVA